MDKIIRPTNICTICWANKTEDSKYGDVCDECLPLTKLYEGRLTFDRTQSHKDRQRKSNCPEE